MLTCWCDCVCLQSYLILTIHVKCFQAKVLAVQKELGREIRVFTNTTASRKPDDVSASATAQSQVLKTRKIREAEAAVRRARITKSLMDFVSDTTPPKERIKDTSKDFYSAGFAPGAIVYFSYDLPKGLFTYVIC
ncbi:hypothetical protein BHM03_00017535 [Ensete ventricosum]|nr:hypothetical protein BHM03_00017535 [Ensete ventricosum]